MNSRIQERIDQASTMSWEVDHAVTTVDAHALAERIVRECAAVCRRVGGLEMEESSGTMYADAVLEHFGVDK